MAWKTGRIQRYLRSALFLLLGAPQLFAQGVRGIVVGADDRVPIHGAFVTLLDENSYQRAAALTDSAGRFFVRAPRPGTYMLRAERIGYESVTSAPMQLTKDTITFHFVVPTEPITLDSIAVSRDRTCRRRPDAPAVYQLWRAINTALRITMFSQESTSMQFELFRYMQDLARDGRTLLAEERIFLKQTGALSFSSLDPKELGRGFMHSRPGERILFGPDALLLISEEFQDAHCFGLVRDAKANAIGLSFQPMKTKPGIIDVKGVLWADARNAELRQLSFEYTNLPSDLVRKGTSGEVEFRKLPSGHWIVQRWWIRMPFYAARVMPRGYLHVYQLGMSEEGGHVISVDGQPSDERRATASVAGQVADSLVQLPIVNALVFVSKLPYQAHTDSLGRYRITGLPPGDYQVAVTTAAKTDMRIPLNLYEVTLPPNGQERLNLISPSDPEIFQTACAKAPRDIGTAIVFGVVRDSASNVPIAGAEIKAEWRGPSLRNPEITNHSRTTHTGEDGRYYLCYMPPDRQMRIKARTPRRPLGAADVTLNGVTRLRLDFPESRN